jgi:hypothetical protein
MIVLPIFSSLKTISGSGPGFNEYGSTKLIRGCIVGRQVPVLLGYQFICAPNCTVCSPIVQYDVVSPNCLAATHYAVELARRRNSEGAELIDGSQVLYWQAHTIRVAKGCMVHRTPQYGTVSF